MRLIDAGEAKKLIFGIDSCFAEFVDNIPTAYDTEKVLNELVVLHDLVNMNQKLAVSQAIDIVKRGGQE